MEIVVVGIFYSDIYVPPIVKILSHFPHSYVVFAFGVLRQSVDLSSLLTLRGNQLVCFSLSCLICLDNLEI